MEAFKPDEEPDDAYSVIGFTDSASTAPCTAATRTLRQIAYYQPPPGQSPGLRLRPRRPVVS